MHINLIEETRRQQAAADPYLPSAPRGPRIHLIDGLIRASWIIAEVELATWLPPEAGLTANRRRQRQIELVGLYVCHILFGLSLTELAAVSGLHRSTVSRGCAQIEDLRDDPAFDQLVGRTERVLTRLLPVAGGTIHG